VKQGRGFLQKRGARYFQARLRRLEKLKADQLITPEEYEKKRAEILKEI